MRYCASQMPRQNWRRPKLSTAKSEPPPLEQQSGLAAKLEVNSIRSTRQHPNQIWGAIPLRCFTTAPNGSLFSTDNILGVGRWPATSARIY